VLTPAARESLVQPPKGQSGQKPISIEIQTLSLPRYLEKPQIVIHTRANQLNMAEYHQWAGDLKKNMIRVMALNLSCQLNTPQVFMGRFPAHGRTDYRIDVEVMQFEPDGQGRVRLLAQWQLFGSGGKKPLAVRISDLETTVLPAAQGYEARVRAMSAVLADLCQRIGQQILTYGSSAGAGG
jgi:uncharacterized lipoprotein YmbA